MMNDNSSLIVVDDVKKYYNDGEIKALDGVSTDIRKGEVVVIIGPSGSGKSTLLRTLNLLEHPTDRKIIFDGVNLMDKNVNINLHRQKMGMVFQHFNLFPHMTVLKNMTIAPMKLLKKSKEEAEKKAMELLNVVNLADRAEAYPAQLSGGQKQRVTIAGIIAMEPKRIVLDEPTAMLDPVGRNEVIDTLHSLNEEKGITIILITHHMNEAIKADRVFVMDKGKLVMQGNPKEVFSHVEKLKSLGLEVPQVTELAYMLKKSGLNIEDGILTVEELMMQINENR